MSHHRQIAEHYRDALAELVRMVTAHIMTGHDQLRSLELALTIATTALDHPPEWDGQLR